MKLLLGSGEDEAGWGEQGEGSVFLLRNKKNIHFIPFIFGPTVSRHLQWGKKFLLATDWGGCPT